MNKSAPAVGYATFLMKMLQFVKVITSIDSVLFYVPLPLMIDLYLDVDMLAKLIVEQVRVRFFTNFHFGEKNMTYDMAIA